MIFLYSVQYAEKLSRVIAEIVEITEYNTNWPALYEQEKSYLLTILPRELIVNIEHIGSAAVPGLPSKPIIDIRYCEITATTRRIIPRL